MKKNKELMPQSQFFYDNVTITTLQPSLLSRMPVYATMYKDKGLNLIAIQNILTILNPELFSSNVKSFLVNKKNNVVLLETSVNIENIKINEKLYPNFELVRFVLIAVKKEMIYVITMRYLDGIGNSNSYNKELESIFNSFRLVN